MSLLRNLLLGLCVILVPALSNLDALEAGVHVQSLSEILQDNSNAARADLLENGVASGAMIALNAAMATELSNTSWSQRIPAGLGVISKFDSISRRSWLARGRNIIRCSPNSTGFE